MSAQPAAQRHAAVSFCSPPLATVVAVLRHWPWPEHSADGVAPAVELSKGDGHILAAWHDILHAHGSVSEEHIDHK